MTFDELVAKYDIHPEVSRVIQEVKDVSGKDVAFQVAPDLSVHATAKLARESMPHHIIFFKPAEAVGISYLIAHECGHIVRMMEVEPRQRLIPATTSTTVSHASHALANEMTWVPQNMKRQMLEVWVGGLTRQLTNLPIDVRIERWLHSEYPGLQQEQQQGLKQEVELMLQVLSKRIEKMTPRTVFRASNAMNYAYLRGVEAIVDKTYMNKFHRKRPVARMGKALYEMLGEEDTGYNGDIQTINQWAEYLGISDWFKWVGFEQVPDSYLTDVT